MYSMKEDELWTRNRTRFADVARKLDTHHEEWASVMQTYLETLPPKRKELLKSTFKVLKQVLITGRALCKARDPVIQRQNKRIRLFRDMMISHIKAVRVDFKNGESVVEALRSPQHPLHELADAFWPEPESEAEATPTPTPKPTDARTTHNKLALRAPRATPKRAAKKQRIVEDDSDSDDDSDFWSD